jgi:YidC/Oxa1 family membrane protein insertase
VLDPLYQVIGWLLSLFYAIVPSRSYGLGIAIILLTMTVMAALFPLTAKQVRSMIAMQRVQPEIKRIQQQYKDDKQKQNEELLKFYQENKINPLAGCLPILVQMPVLISLYGVLRNIEDHVPTSSRLFRDLCRGVSTAAQCTGDIKQHLRFASMDLSVSPANAGQVADGFLERIPYFVAVALVVFLGWYQQRQTMLRQQQNPAMRDNPINKQMQVMAKVFPVLFGWFAYIASSGIVLYFVTSSLWRIGQQHLVLNKYYDEADAERARQQSKDKGASAGVEPDGGPEVARPEGARPAGGRPSPHTSRKKRKRRR